MEQIEEHPPLLCRLLEQVPKESIELLQPIEKSYFYITDDSVALAQAHYIRTHPQLREQFQEILSHYRFVSKMNDDILRCQKSLVRSFARSGFPGIADLFNNGLYEGFIAIRHPHLMEYRNSFER